MVKAVRRRGARQLNGPIAIAAATLMALWGWVQVQPSRLNDADGPAELQASSALDDSPPSSVADSSPYASFSPSSEQPLKRLAAEPQHASVNPPVTAPSRPRLAAELPRWLRTSRE